ncbi:MYXO-CTERM sorting domain-containing protein [Pedococcus sp.]|uniref:MYXO-CTERM sorting domain-containing protein n=1 Tax=Pedococcus sp. TaxID=2860345 RepID=UPI002E0E7A83|nr:MYXO-CTERM sorting domain-containing protein [Pedococcus sp.]
MSAPKLPVPSVSVPSVSVPSVSVPSVPALPLPSVPAPKLPVPSGSVPPVSVPSLPVPVSTAPVPGVPSVPGVPAPVGSVLSGVQSGAKSGVGQLSGGLSGITGVSGGTPGSLLNLGVNASPIATACVQAKGTGTAIANVTVTVAGHDITAPLVQALPGVLAPCPGGATPGSPGVGASAGGGLVGACVQATAKAPLNASVLVLDTELVGTLTQAGVPLQQVVVPCPKGITGGQPGTGGTGGTPGSSGAGGASGAGSAAGRGPAAGSAAGLAAAGGKGQGGSGAGCANGSGGWSSLNAETLASVIPSNVPQTLPWILLVLALLGRRRLGRAVASVRTFRGFGRFRVQT